MAKLLSAEVFIDVYARINGVWTYIGSYWPEFDVCAKAHHGLAHLRKLAVSYFRLYMGYTAIRTELGN